MRLTKARALSPAEERSNREERYVVENLDDVIVALALSLDTQEQLDAILAQVGNCQQRKAVLDEMRPHLKFDPEELEEIVIL